MENSELLEAILSEVKGMRQDLVSANERIESIDERLVSTNERIESISERMDAMQEDVAEIKEDAAVTRASVNKLLDWADDASIQVIPLFNKRK